MKPSIITNDSSFQNTRDFYITRASAIGGLEIVSRRAIGYSAAAPRKILASAPFSKVKIIPP
jgi:hypothetical protein